MSRVARVGMLLSTLVACGEPRWQVTPAQVPLSGGVQVRIHGQDLDEHGGVIVLVGAEPARAVVIEDEHSIRVTVPPGPEAGAVDVELRFADGTSERLEGALRFVPGELDVR